jgi:hypothetical protein
LITPGRNVRRRFTNGRGSAHRLAVTASILALALAILAAPIILAADTISWVQYRAIFMRVDDESPKEWTVWRDAHSKKDEVLLIQWNKRYLRVNTKLQEVREIDPQTVTHKDNSATSPADDSSAKVLPSDGWILRDVGSADRIYFELTAENHKVDINIPHGGR